MRLHDQLSLQLVVCAAERQSSLQVHARMHGVGEGAVPCGTAVEADSVWGACGHPCERLGPGGANPDRSGREQVPQHLMERQHVPVGGAGAALWAFPN